MTLVVGLQFVECKGVQTRPTPTPAGPTKPPDLHPISTQTDAPVGRLRVFAPKTRRPQGWRVSSPKPEPLDSKMLYTNPANSSKIKLKFKEIQRYQSQIRGEPAKFQQLLVKKCRIWQENAGSSEFFQIPARLLFRFQCFLYSGDPLGPTDTQPHSKLTRPIFPTVDYRFLRPPPNTGRANLSWVQNRPMDNPS